MDDVDGEEDRVKRKQDAKSDVHVLFKSAEVLSRLSVCFDTTLKSLC